MSAPTRKYGKYPETLPATRVPTDVRTAAETRAAHEGVKLTEIVRRAVEAYLNMPPQA